MLAQNPSSSKIKDAPEFPFVYECQSGAVIHAAYPTTNTAIVKYEESLIKMELDVSASGARYIGGGLTWWTKGSDVGSEGTLFMDDSSEESDIIEACEQTSEATLQNSETRDPS